MYSLPVKRDNVTRILERKLVMVRPLWSVSFSLCEDWNFFFCVNFFFICRGFLFYSPEFKEYCITFMGSDGSVVKRTQRYLHTELQQTPVSYCYLHTVFWVHRPVSCCLRLWLMSLPLAGSMRVMRLSRWVLLLSDFWACICREFLSLRNI